ncbi:MAG: tRNA pseudouridine(13) synthase TruD [Deltaproteobacteria bacterium]|nr:tRNA pseudouridine(13) synthase TruD [Deltaproteobacteria bacterium]
MSTGQLPYLTADVPGSGGVLRRSPEDFVVEEVPAYLPCGEGEHLYLHVRKRGLSTPELARQLARALGVGEREVSWAGLKDRHAVTTQWLSLPAKTAEVALAGLQLPPGVELLTAKRHGNKLKNGHLRGNRFTLWLRDVADAGAAHASFERLVAAGVPNYFGEQRFGLKDDNAEAGKLLLRGERLPRRPSAFERKLFLSAYQSQLFNRLAAARVEAGTLGRALSGDVLRKTETGGLFVCEVPEVDQPRVEAREVSPAGPLYGPKVPRAAGAVAEAEEAVLASEGMTLEDFRRGKDETEGGRRPYRVFLGEPAFEQDGTGLRLAFSLPRGSYATVVVRELTKGAPAAG